MGVGGELEVMGNRKRKPNIYMSNNMSNNSKKKTQQRVLEGNTSKNLF